MHSATLTAAPFRPTRTASGGETAGDSAPVNRDVQRARRQLRCLNAAYIEAGCSRSSGMIGGTASDARRTRPVMPMNAAG
jgi:hypothetical protein